MSNNPHEAADSNPAVSTSSVSIVPTWFWVVSIIALLWNLMGLLAFVAQMVMLNSEAMMAALPADTARDPMPPSNPATRCSNASQVGFMMRE